jgi:FAD:protein FMN transferase
VGAGQFGHLLGQRFGVGDLGGFLMPLVEELPVTERVAQWAVWGTTARVVVEDVAALPAASELVRAELQRVDDACNRFRDDSELARLPRGRRVRVSPVLADLLREALLAAARTDGDVDPTLGDAMSALGYDRPLAQFSTRTGIPVTVVARDRPGWRSVELRGDQLLVPAGVHLDLGSTAKAVAADRCAERVHAELGTDVLVALGGDVATVGGPWQVLVQDGPDQPGQVVELPRNGAVATSSTRSRRWRHGTRELHHVLDPTSLRPADAVWRSVSVAAGRCVEANTASTAALVRGHAALPWFREAGVSARLVSAAGDVLTTGRWPS